MEINEFIEKLYDTAEYEPEPAGKNEMVIHCPYCGHHNKKLSINTVKGVFKCLVCEEKGNISSLAKKLGIMPDKPTGASYMASRGFTEDVPSNVTVRNESIDFILLDGVSVQSRKVEAKNTGDRYKIKGESCGYSPEIKEDSQKLLIVEGNFDALSANLLLAEQGYDVVATLGITNRAFLDYLDAYEEYYVAFDKEETEDKQKRVDKNRDDLASIISERYNEAKVYICDGLSGEWKDINDAHVHSVNAGKVFDLGKQVEATRMEWSGGPRIYESATQLIEETFSFLGDENLVRGQTTFYDGLDEMIGGFRLGEITVLQASAKIGKSTLFHNLLYRAASNGLPQGYCSREMTPSSEVLPDIYSIHFETNFIALFKDKKKLEGMKTKVIEYAKNLPIYFSSGYGYYPIDDFKAWIKALKKLGVKYFYFDHLHFAQLDQEDYKEVNKYLSLLKTVAKEEKIHIFLVIQPGGNDKLRGGVSLVQTLDTLLILDRLDPRDNDGRLISRLRIDKARSKASNPDKIVYFEYNKEIKSYAEVEIERPVNPIETKTYMGGN